MKLSEFKNFIINKFGKEKWEKYKGAYGYKIYSATEEEQLKIVQKEGTDIQYISNPTEKIQLEAVKKNGYAIRFIKNPSEKVQLLAVKQDGYALHYINNPSEKVMQQAIKGINYLYDGECLLRHLENDLKDKREVTNDTI